MKEREDQLTMNEARVDELEKDLQERQDMLEQSNNRIGELEEAQGLVESCVGLCFVVLSPRPLVLKHE